MRKVFLGLCVSMLLVSFNSVNGSSSQAFFESLMDMAYPFQDGQTADAQERVSLELMEKWIDAVLPWEEGTDEYLVQEEVLTEIDPVAPLSKTQEQFTGIPEDHFVTIRQAGNTLDMSSVKSYYNQELIQNYEQTVRLYNYDSESMSPSPEFIDGGKFLGQDLSLKEEDLKQGEDPSILIFHTHAHEGYSDKEEFGILDVGDYLEEILETQYGVSVLHHKAIYDEGGVNGAYTRMGEDIAKVLEENPSIQVAIDMHRDGVAEDTRLVTNVNGKEVAEIMLVTGVSRTFDENGELKLVEYLPNENLDSVLALGFQMKMAADAVYPGFMRPLYLSNWRYSTYMLPRSMLLEVGAQTNTLVEAKAAMEPFAELLMSILLEE